MQSRGRKPLTDRDLHRLLHHPTVQSCTELALNGFHRLDREHIPVVEHHIVRTNERLARKLQRKRKADVDFNNKQPIDWTTIRLPAVTRLRIQLQGKPPYIGGAAFLTAHTALLHLDINTMIASVAELTAVFANSNALPHLTRFTLHKQELWGENTVYNLTPLLTALGTTVVGASGRVRPMEWLHLDLPSEQGVLAATANAFPRLTRLQIDKIRVGWIEEWTGTREMISAFPLLQECVVHTNHITSLLEVIVTGSVPTAVARNMLPFFQSMAERPLRLLDIRIGEPVTFTASDIVQLSRLDRLQQLDFSTGTADWMDWADPALFASFSAGCLPCLRFLTLETVRISTEAVVAIASAAPQLQEFSTVVAEPTCHPAVVVAILGGYCEQIEVIRVDDQRCHVWKDVQAGHVIHAYQSAVAAAGRDEHYLPLADLHHLQLTMCWCTPPSVWHALLSLMKHATRVRCVAKLSSNDPLVIAALGYLPCISSLGSDSLWPATFATFMEQKSERTGRYRYLTSREVIGCPSRVYPRQGPAFELTDQAEQGDVGRPILLRRRSDLFTAFQRSLIAGHQNILARWATGAFLPGDGQLSAVESALVMDTDEKSAVAVGRRACQYPHLFFARFVGVTAAIGEEDEEEMSDVEDERSEPDDEEKHGNPVTLPARTQPTLTTITTS